MITTKEYAISEVRTAIATLRASGARVVKMETASDAWTDMAGRPVGRTEVLHVGRGGRVMGRVDGLVTRIQPRVDWEARHLAQPTISITVEEAVP